MTPARRLLTAVATLASGNVATSGMLFARNLAVAALLPIEDYGITAGFALVITAVESSTAIGLQQHVVQSADGDDPRTVKVLQTLALARGVIAAILMLLLAEPLARLMGAPEAAWGYAVLALCPLINGLEHLDVVRQTRAMRYRAQMLVRAVPAAATLAAIYPLALWLGDWRAMVAALVLQALIGVAMSLALAERRWALAFDGARTRVALAFGWPILIDMMMSLAVFQGDRMLVASAFDLATLGAFAMAVTLTMTPALMLNSMTFPVALRLLSACDATTAAGRAQLADRWSATARALAALAALYAVGCAIVVPPAMLWVTSTEFHAAVALVPLLAAAQALRIVRGTAIVAALARGVSSIGAWSAAPRVVALALAWAALEGGAGLEAVLLLAIAGEGAGLLVAAALAARRCGYALRPALPAAAAALSAVAALVLDQTALAVVLALAAALLAWPRGAFPNPVPEGVRP